MSRPGQMFAPNSDGALLAWVRLILLFCEIQSKLRVLIGPGYVDGHDLAVLFFLNEGIHDFEQQRLLSRGGLRNLCV